MPALEEASASVEFAERKEKGRTRSRRRARSHARVFGWWEWSGAVLASVIILSGILAGGFARIDISRAIAWGGSALAGCWALISWASGRWRPSRPFPSGWVLLLMGAMLVISLIQLVPLNASLAASLSPMWADILGSFQQSGLQAPSSVPLAVAPEKAWHSVNQLLAAMGFFAAAVVLASYVRGARILLLAVVAFALVEGWWGLAHFLQAGAERARGAIYNPNHHAAAVIMAMPVAIAYLIRLRGKRTRYGDPHSESYADKILLLFALIFAALLGWMLSFSRGSLAASLIVLIPWIAYEVKKGRPNDAEDEDDHPSHRKPRRRFPVFEVAMLGGALLLVVLFGAVAEGFTDRISKQETMPLIDRVYMWKASLQGLADTNFLGLGFGGAEYAMNVHFTEFPTRETPIWSHNDYVQLLSELGVLFAVAAAVAGFLLVRSIRRQTRQLRDNFPSRARFLRRAVLAGLMIGLVHALVDFHLRIPSIMFMFLALLALYLNKGVLLALHNAATDEESV